MLLFMDDNHIDIEDQENSELFIKYGMDRYLHEVFECAHRNLHICTNISEVRKVVDTLFSGLGQPGFYKLKIFEERKTVTFGNFRKFSSSNKIMDIVRRHDGVLSNYCDQRAIFNNTQHLLYLVDIENFEDKHVSNLNDALIDFSREVCNWMNHNSKDNE